MGTAARDSVKRKRLKTLAGVVCSLLLGSIGTLWRGSCHVAKASLRSARPASSPTTLAGVQLASECARGFWLGSREQLWQFLDSDDRPKLVDVLESNGTVYAVFTYKSADEKRGVIQITDHGWAREPWTFTFHLGAVDSPLAAPPAVVHAPGVHGPGSSITVNATSKGRSPHGHTLVVHAPLPPQVAAGLDRSRTINVTIASTGSKPANYSNYPLCLAPLDAPVWLFAHCTQILATPAALDKLPEWLSYHALAGFEHAFLYVNGPIATARRRLASYVASGRVTLVAWHMPPRYKDWFVFQQAQEMSCIYRARNQVAWLLMSDMDEFPQPMKPGESVPATVQRLCGGGSASNTSKEGVHTGGSGWRTCAGVGALQLKNWFFGMATKASEQARLDAAARGTPYQLARYQYRAAHHTASGREKLLVRPCNVHYFSVHIVTSGGRTVPVDPAKDMRLVHFQRPGPDRTFVEFDDSMAKLVPQIERFAAAIDAGKQPDQQLFGIP